MDLSGHPNARLIGEAGESGLGYAFNMLTVVQEDGVYYWASDSGCSCPSPFENHQFPGDFESGNAVQALSALTQWGAGIQADDDGLRTRLMAARPEQHEQEIIMPITIIDALTTARMMNGEPEVPGPDDFPDYSRGQADLIGELYGFSSDDKELIEQVIRQQVGTARFVITMLRQGWAYSSDPSERQRQTTAEMEAWLENLAATAR